MSRTGVLMLLLAMTGCINHDRDPVTHVLVCWLKSPGNESDRQRLISTARSFEGRIPGLKTVRAGRPLPSTRPVVDSSYDVAFVMTFDSEEALRAYDNNPIHKQAVKDVLQPLVTRLVIYDFADTKR